MLPIQLLGVSWQSKLGHDKIWLQKNVLMVENGKIQKPTKVWKQSTTTCIVNVLMISLPVNVYVWVYISHYSHMYMFWIIFFHVCIRAQLYTTLCDPMDCSPPGSSLSMRFSRQEYWSGLPFLPPEDLPDSEIKLASSVSLAYQVGSLPLSHLGSLLNCTPS